MPFTYKTMIIITSLGLSSLISCNKSKSDSNNSSSGTAYSFSASSSAAIGQSSWLLPNFLNTNSNDVSVATVGPTLCGSTICFTPTSLTGKYFGHGFLIQSNGHGMMAYFGQDSWSGITGTSTSYNFDTSAPITNTANLTCCSGTGDLSSANSYISDVAFLFGYLDATFNVSGVTSNTNMNTTFTVRFILADGVIATAKRGDLMLKDPSDSIFKWMDSSASAGGNIGAGTLVTTRPSDANTVTMNSSIVSYTNPFGTDQGNQVIPVIYAPVVSSDGTSPFSITESNLKLTGRTYTINFNPTNFIMFPTLQAADINMLYSYKEMLSKIHLGGLPHSQQSRGVGSPASTILTAAGGT